MFWVYVFWVSGWSRLGVFGHVLLFGGFVVWGLDFRVLFWGLALRFDLGSGWVWFDCGC